MTTQAQKGGREEEKKAPFLKKSSVSVAPQEEEEGDDQGRAWVRAASQLPKNFEINLRSAERGMPSNYSVVDFSLRHLDQPAARSSSTAVRLRLGTFYLPGDLTAFKCSIHLPAQFSVHLEQLMYKNLPQRTKKFLCYRSAALNFWWTRVAHPPPTRVFV